MELTSNSGNLSCTGKVSLRTVPFQGTNLVPFSKSPEVQILKSEAEGVKPTIPEAVSLIGPRHSSSGHNTKVSMIKLLKRCKYFWIVLYGIWSIFFNPSPWWQVSNEWKEGSGRGKPQKLLLCKYQCILSIQDIFKNYSFSKKNYSNSRPITLMVQDKLKPKR